MLTIMKQRIILSVLCFSLIFANGGAIIAQDNANKIVTNNTIIRMRSGSGYQYPFVVEIPPSQSVEVIGLSTDSQWIEINYAGQLGWIFNSGYALPQNLPIITPPNALPPLPTQNCISLVGDSIPEGRLVFLVPGHGFPVIQTRPVADVLQEKLNERGLGYITVHDRSVGAANLSNRGKLPYRDTDTFIQLLQDRCRFVVMAGWNNDLNVEHDEGAFDYAKEVRNFVRQLSQISPHTQIVVMTHYWGNPQEFVPGYSVGVTFENYQAHVNEILEACQPDDILGALHHVTCLETQPLFEGMGTSFVELENTRETLNQIVWGSIPPDAAPMFDIFWRENPNSTLTGDGVHLSTAGKDAYTEGILDHLLAIEPDL